MNLLAAALIFATTWSTHGPTGGRIAAVAVAPSDADVIWTGNAAGVFRSTDGGATWTNAGGSILDVDALAVHPTRPDTAWVMAGAWPNARVYATVDGGATWIDYSDSLPEIRPGSIYVDPQHPGTLYLSSHCGPIGFASIGSLPAAPQFHETAGIFKSTNGGVTWAPVDNGLTAFGECAEEFAIDPFSPWRLFITGPYSDVAGQSESYDEARSWERAATPRPGRGVVFDARFPFTHYGITATLGPKFLVSQDGGFTWNEVPTNLGLDNFRFPTAISMDPERSRIFLGTTTGLYRSGNGGSVWAQTSLQNTNVTSLDFGGSPRSLFAGTQQGLFQIVNRGIGAARLVDLHDPSSNVTALAVDPGNPSIVYAGARTPGGGVQQSRVFRSTDGGASWQRLAGDDDALKTDVMAVGADGEIYAAPSLALSSLYRRGRDDAQWTVTPLAPIYDIAADPKTPGVAFLATSGTLLRTRDGGASWQQVAKSVTRAYLAIDPSDPRWVYAAEGSQFQRSDDGGDTWSVLSKYPDDAGTFGPLVIAPSNGSVLYRIGADKGLFRPERSDDRGATWSAVPLPAAVPIQSIAVDPHDENKVWVAASTAIYRSVDGGKSWTAVAPPFVINSVTKLLFDPSGRVLHATFPDHGVWELTTE
jgi:photosystem II stability/assembly factor-like uncharacterized protein